LLVMGVDPGTARLGYGFVGREGSRVTWTAHGCLTPPAGAGAAERLLFIAEGLRDLIRAHSPSAMAVEELFFSRNVSTALAVGQARGVALLAAAEAGLPVREFTPGEVKLAVTGYGRASKEQVQFMVKSILRLPDAPEPDDAADALAVAICCHHTPDHLRRNTP
jgi:crossover junction endodeoxyribonuclease RuvC